MKADIMIQMDRTPLATTKRKNATCAATRLKLVMGRSHPAMGRRRRMLKLRSVRAVDLSFMGWLFS